MSEAASLATPAPAVIRFFCLVLPVGGAQLGFDYLEALNQTGLGVAACPIGQAFFMSEPWARINALFAGGPVAERYINIVCAPPNYVMGRRLRESDVKAPGRLPAPGEETLPFALSATRGAPGPGQDVIYEPQTALGGLFTGGVPNIAVTMPRPRPPDENEARSLRQYDAVLTPTAEDAAALRHLEITAFHVPPESEQLKNLVKQFLEL